MKPGKALNPNVHGARGLFAFAVFVFHVVNSGLPTFPGLAGSWFETYLLESLKFGVELFFGISGYVIVGALARAPTLRAFAWDRVTRIYPVLWASLLVITLLALVTGRWRPSLGDWLLNFAAPPPFIHVPQINPAAWSLGYEMTFYALCAAAWWLKGKGVRWWLPIAIAVGALLVVFFPRAILMGAGVAIAAHHLDGPRWRWVGALPLTSLILFLIVWRAIEAQWGTPMLYVSPALLPFGQWLTMVPAILLGGLFGTMALKGIVDGRGPFVAMLRTRPMLWLGTVSYSFYLWHPVVMAGAKQAMVKFGLVAQAGPASQLLFALIAIGPTLVVSHYSQVYLEARLTRWLRRRVEKDAAHAPVTADADFSETVALDRAG
ncbi:acyltransferase [Sphingomonas sp. DBB INV C78]|uniref:acyltransferase family protein n=1 Tax=Sphingomonas sp. DBB INV C78 TaxID=3349434 RepID=UPI0036D392D9